jgi:hypothetical protein
VAPDETLRVPQFVKRGTRAVRSRKVYTGE